MIRTILHHDIETAQVVIRFEHEGVTYTDAFDLKLVLPGTMHTLGQLELPFDEGLQLKVIDRLTKNIQIGIEAGTIKNPPASQTPPADVPSAMEEPEIKIEPEGAPVTVEEEEDDGTADIGADLPEPSKHGTGASVEPSDQP